MGFSYVSVLLLILDVAFVLAGPADLQCRLGIRGKGSDTDVCCAAACGECGGAYCSSRLGGANACCVSAIRSSKISCATSSPPCVAPPTDVRCETGIRGVGADFDVCCAPGCGKCGGIGCEKRPGGASACCAGTIRSRRFSCAEGSPPCLAPPTDIQCKTGIRGEGSDTNVCCPIACGTCGGASCGSRPAGPNACCVGAIRSSGVSCATNSPPCLTPRLRRLEPTGHRVLHGAGQSDEEFGGYWDYLPSKTKPMFYTRYYDLPQLNSDGAGARFFDGYRKKLDRLGDASHTILLHIAIAFRNGDGHPVLDEINSGHYDLAIDELVRGLPHTERPVFLRLGYEFNGEWNKYDPAKFKQAWKRVAQRLEQDEATRRQVALVWDMSCNAQNKDWSSYFPGEDYVDWWGVNVLDPGDGPSAPNSACVREFVDAAGNRAYPVMIAESMPERIGTQAPDVWSKWFDPYLNQLLKHPAVKAFNYINRDCRTTSPTNCNGRHWGTARIQDSPHVGQMYARALTSSDFVHAGHLQDTCDVLNVACLPRELVLFS